MVLVCPSVLSADFTCLGEDCARVLNAGADMIHFDVMDGHFVDNLSFGLPVLETLHHALPQAVMDVHLMISHPLRFVHRFAAAGADYITVHVETTDNLSATLAAIHGCGCKRGMALNPDTPVEAVFPYLDQLELVLVMGVVPGHGGQPFDPRALDKLRALRAECARRGVSPILSVDGGVKPGTTAPQCTEAGATALVAGSAVFGAKDASAAVRQLKG
ncbi:ribulose-phosphate 3-epimerase [Pseudoflavonifractor sp. An44]|uniref:ribulose-phosphate 3-epimerase n=1 Tax=Pseudoflavonifractor sp. An44 TaxID=1965635 RepID=UPI000B38E0C5|nr:ribulose-phosphate 3-epimerase [Pseudoflavonifractor sp. An44]OUN99080.1 ribulose-phosphate 3-epimerase [Pseudoflavonifractor sp. An44]